jgi:HD-GYP domain-containing protein (c-di-GMP phosphodiesterase class II)
MAISDKILFNTGDLDDAEWEIMRKHPVIANDLLSQVKFLQPALSIPNWHHERWDGG